MVIAGVALGVIAPHPDVREVLERRITPDFLGRDPPQKDGSHGIRRERQASADRAPHRPVGLLGIPCVGDAVSDDINFYRARSESRLQQAADRAERSQTV